VGKTLRCQERGTNSKHRRARSKTSCCPAPGCKDAPTQTNLAVQRRPRVAASHVLTSTLCVSHLPHLGMTNMTNFPTQTTGTSPRPLREAFPRRTRRWATSAAQSRRQARHSSRDGTGECGGGGGGKFARLVEQAWAHRRAGEAEHARLLEEDRQMAQKLHRRAVPWSKSRTGAAANRSGSPGGRERR
jgi:hypothetical protein